MFRDLWAIRLSAFGNIDRNGGLPFSTATPPSTTSTLPNERTMNESLIQVMLPFKENKELFSDYVNIYGGIRFGKIMEDLDVFAATCAYLHCGTATIEGEKLTIVTAAVDRIDVQMRLDEPLNLRMKGMVTFVGKSSMEVTIVIESSNKNCENELTEKVKEDVVIDQLMRGHVGEEGQIWKLAAIAKFIMVARGVDGSVSVPKLKLLNPQEEAIFSAGAERHATRIKRAHESLFKEPPTASESVLLHSLFLKSSTSEQINQIPMSSTILATTKLCHPQERNIHDFIFGGYLMREAFELGFTCGKLFSHSELLFLAVDELAFKHPVPIGAVLQLTAQVVYTENRFDQDLAESNKTKISSSSDDETPNSQLIHVEVVADVICIKSGDRKTTNTFHFTYRLEHEPKYSVKPSTYVEAMKYLEGKRRISCAPLDPLGTIYKF